MIERTTCGVVNHRLNRRNLANHTCPAGGCDETEFTAIRFLLFQS